jgi:hypothetical protein
MERQLRILQFTVPGLEPGKPLIGKREDGEETQAQVLLPAALSRDGVRLTTLLNIRIGSRTKTFPVPTEKLLKEGQEVEGYTFGPVLEQEETA